MAKTEETYKYLPSRLAQRLLTSSINVDKPMDGMRQSQHHSDSIGSSVEFAEYREYHPGDPINRVDWAVYARTDRHVIREAFKEVSATCYVLLDISASMDYQHDGPMSKLDYGKYLAAAMMFAMVNQSDSSALVTFDAKMKGYFEPASTPSGLKPALLHLEDVQTGGEGNIEASLHDVAELLSDRSLIVVISDFLQDCDSMLRGLHHLHHEGMDVTVFHVVDPSEMTLSMRGLTELIDMETGQKLSLDLDAVRDTYIRQANRHIERIQRTCLNMQMDYFFCDTRKPVHEPVLKRSF